MQCVKSNVQSAMVKVQFVECEANCMEQIIKDKLNKSKLYKENCTKQNLQSKFHKAYCIYMWKIEKSRLHIARLCTKLSTIDLLCTKRELCVNNDFELKDNLYFVSHLFLKIS